MVNVMHSAMKNPGKTMALALAFAPLGARAAHAQEARTSPRSHAQICVNGQCTDDTSRVLVVRLMGKVDSLQRIFLGKPMSADDRERVKGQMEVMIRQLTDLSQNAVAFGLQEANDATREAMNDAARQMYQLRVEPRVTADATPKGWIGLTFVGVPVTDVRDGEYYVQFLDYPEVESVEPASPAQRAGIAHGDLLLSFNGQDVTSRAISMTRLLQPNRKIVVRMERNGEPHDYSLVVAKAPQSYASRMDDFTAPRAPAPPTAPVMAEMPTPPAAAPAPRGVFYVSPQPAPVNGMVRAGSSFSFNGSDEMAGVAGASMSTLNPDFAKNLHLGADHGVLVIDAPAGTPAAEAGLRNGDIVVKVGGVDVATVREMRRALERRAGEDTIELQIVRDKHKQTIKINND
jgi:C-terminal processing protease CtpA/Prc